MSDIEIKEKILDFLKKYYPKDFSIKEVAIGTGYHRNTVSTYLKVLEAGEEVYITRNFGKINLYSYFRKNLTKIDKNL